MPQDGAILQPKIISIFCKGIHYFLLHVFDCFICVCVCKYFKWCDTEWARKRHQQGSLEFGKYAKFNFWYNDRVSYFMFWCLFSFCLILLHTKVPGMLHKSKHTPNPTVAPDNNRNAFTEVVLETIRPSLPGQPVRVVRKVRKITAPSYPQLPQQPQMVSYPLCNLWKCWCWFI